MGSRSRSSTRFATCRRTRICWSWGIAAVAASCVRARGRCTRWRTPPARPWSCAARSIGGAGRWWPPWTSGTSEKLLDFAFTEAASRGARLKAVSAPAPQWPRLYARRASGHAAERAEEALEELLESWPERYPEVVTDHELIEGSPTAFLTGATTYADLIVVGAHRRSDGRHGMKLGPVAKTLLQHADCPVAVVPHD